MSPCLWCMFLFQFLTVLFIPPLQQIKGSKLSEIWPDLSTACCRKSRRRHHCPLLNNGKNTLSLTIRGSLQMMTKTFSLAPVWWQHWTKLVVITYVQNFVVMPVTFLKNRWIVLSTVAARSVIGHGISCFYHEIVVGRDDVAPSQLFNKLLDGLLVKGWTRGSEVEASRAVYQSFVQEQRQLELSSTRSRPDVGDVLSIWSAQVGFRARRYPYNVFIVSNQTSCFETYELSCPLMSFCCFRYSS